jgi:hypothetical protein
MLTPSSVTAPRRSVYQAWGPVMTAGKLMKTKQKLTYSQVRKTVRKPLPKPCRAFRSRARLELGRKAWRSKLELE